MSAWEAAAPALAIAVCAALAAWMLARAAAALLGWQRDRLTHLSRVQFEELFLFVDPARLLVLNAVAALVAAALSASLLGPVGALVALGLCGIAPSALYRPLRRRRLRALERQLPDVADAIAGSLRSGMGLGQAVARIAMHQPPPASEEFALALREHRLGIALDEALAAVAARTGLRDLHMLVAVLGIARDLGGGLAGALERLAASMRRRIAMEDRIRALTSQGRLQGIVMGLLPIGLAAVLWVLEPQQMGKLFTEPLGWLTIGVVALLELGGFVLLRKIVRIEV